MGQIFVYSLSTLQDEVVMFTCLYYSMGALLFSTHWFCFRKPWRSRTFFCLRNYLDKIACLSNNQSLLSFRVHVQAGVIFNLVMGKFLGGYIRFCLLLLVADGNKKICDLCAIYL